MGGLLIKSRATPFPISHYPSRGEKTKKSKGWESLRCRAASHWVRMLPIQAKWERCPRTRVVRACTKGEQHLSLQQDGYWDSGSRSQCSHGSRVGHHEFLGGNLQTRDSSFLENSVGRRLEELPMMTGQARGRRRGSTHMHTVCWAKVRISPSGPSGHPRR